MGRTGFVLAVAALLAAPVPGATPTAAAQEQAARAAAPAALEGVAEVAVIAPDQGLIDLAIADDGAGRLAYVAADAATRAEVRVIDVATGAEARRFDVSALTAAPSRLWFVGDGVFVVGAPVPTEADPMPEGVVGALFDATGKEVRRFGPAAAIAIVDVKGKPQVAVKRVTAGKQGGEVHELERFDPRKGKRIGKARRLTLVDGKDARLGLRVNHWTADGTVAVGIKDGEWNKQADIRSPDVEGRYDLVTGAMAKVKIADVMDHTRRFQVLAAAGGIVADPFARVADDLTGVEVWRGERPVTVTLETPFALYDPKSLTWAVDDDGTVWLGLAVDPWNRPAVERKKADPEYFDLFRVDAAGQGTRVGRILAPKARFAIGATAGHVWLLERSVGFSRGGKRLTIYKPAR